VQRRKREIIHVQCIKFGIPHEQCPARRPVLSIGDDVRGLAGIAPWSQKNGTPRNAVKHNPPLTKKKEIYIQKEVGVIGEM
jgi:hypothetical protein